jgi:hypothetical protein
MEDVINRNEEVFKQEKRVVAVRRSAVRGSKRHSLIYI